jgi:UDP-2-acetamido-2-deoxy-ribo-hexuluronate aminotransferase
VARGLADRVMSLPMGPYLPDEDIRRVCTALLEAVNASSATPAMTV